MQLLSDTPGTTNDTGTMRRGNAGRALSFLLCVAALALCAPCASAQLVVNSLADAPDAIPGDCNCDADLAQPGNQCTLRAAIMEANACAALTVILLPPGIYQLGVSGGGENACAMGDLDVLCPSLTIIGGGAGTKIDGFGIDRIFDVSGGSMLRLTDMVITGGDPGAGSPPGAPSANGGAIRVGGFGGAGSISMERV